MPDRESKDAVDELLQRRSQVEIPTEVEDRLSPRLVEFRTRIEQRLPDRSRSLVHAFKYRPPMRVLSMAAALLIALAVGLVLMPTESRANQVFAAAAAQLRTCSTLQYTMVLNAEPYAAFDFSYLAPGYRRLNFSWGIEVRTDGATGKQIVLMHGARTYLTESGKQVESQASIDDFAQQMRSLPPKADQVLGEQWNGGTKLIGYRLHKAPENGSIPGLKSLDLWIDSASREPDHIDITVQEQGKPAHQMHIRNIRVGAAVDRSLFDLTPPAGYTAFPIPRSEPAASATPTSPAVQVHIATAAPLTAVIMPMQGPYGQTHAALQAVESYLTTLDVTPVGPPLGRYESERHWDAGYPVPPGTNVKAPFQFVSLPSMLTASAVVSGAWGQNSSPRWADFVKSVVEQGYMPAGPAMEIWSGEESQPLNQSTEMRMPVTKAN